MNPIRSKHIIIGLVVTFILFLFYKKGDEDYSYDHTGAQSLRPIPTHSSYYKLESEQALTKPSTWSSNQSSVNRHEVLQTKVKGYSEETYWGEQTFIDEKVKHMDDDEFDRFMEEVELNDADVYWGATYNE